MHKKIFEMVPFLAMTAAAFYLLPLVVKDTGSNMFVLLSVLPIVVLVCALLYGMKHGFHLLYAVIVGLLFLPTLLVFFNESALIYAGIYGLIALGSNATGAWVTRSGKTK